MAKNKFLNGNPAIVERVLKALIEAEKFMVAHPEEFVDIISQRHDARKNLVKNFMACSNFEVSLYPSLISTLNEEAKWAIKYKLTSHTNIPDYGDLIFSGPLKSIRPECVAIQ